MNLNGTAVLLILIIWILMIISKRRALGLPTQRSRILYTLRKNRCYQTAVILVPGRTMEPKRVLLRGQPKNTFGIFFLRVYLLFLSF